MSVTARRSDRATRSLGEGYRSAHSPTISGSTSGAQRVITWKLMVNGAAKYISATDDFNAAQHFAVGGTIYGGLVPEPMLLGQTLAPQVKAST